MKERLTVFRSKKPEPPPLLDAETKAQWDTLKGAQDGHTVSLAAMDGKVLVMESEVEQVEQGVREASVVDMKEGCRVLEFPCFCSVTSSRMVVEPHVVTICV